MLTTPNFPNHTNTISVNYEPQTYKQVIKFPQWNCTIKDELTTMKINNTWFITHLPTGKKAISCKWIFKLKLNSNDIVIKHKGRLVSHGFTQQCGLNFQW